MIANLEVVYRKYYRQLVLFADNYINDLIISEDIVQECFVDFLNAEKSKKPINNVKSYLYQTVKFKSLKYIRDNKPTEELSETINLHTDGIKKIINDIERNTRIFDALQKLTPKRKDILLKVYCYDYSYKEIAEDLGISVNTVKSQLKSAKEQLKDLLSDFHAFLIFLKKFLKSTHP